MFLATAAALAILAGWALYLPALRALFFVSGTITVPEDQKDRFSKPNTMLFIIAKSRGGVPVAVKKVINPGFPYDFQLSAQDLILPDLVGTRLFVEAAANTHGEIGAPKNGDLRGEARESVTLVRKRLRLDLSPVQR